MSTHEHGHEPEHKHHGDHEPCDPKPIDPQPLSEEAPPEDDSEITPAPDPGGPPPGP